MTYQSKGVGKIADFETLILCICSNARQLFTYFCKDLVTDNTVYHKLSETVTNFVTLLFKFGF